MKGNWKHGHGRSGNRSPEYAAWKSMRSRCTNPHSNVFKHYGGRGIRVCERWVHFETFLADMGNKPSTEHSLDRWPNVDGDYEPGNCRWATRSEQARNRRDSFRVEVDGQMVALADLADAAGVSYRLARNRMERGASLQKALETGKHAWGTMRP